MRSGKVVQSEIMTPDYARNMKLIGYSDQGGRCDGVQIMVQDGYACIGHQFSDGFSVVDVRDPRNPKTVNEPKEIGALVPPAPRRLMDTRSGRAQVIQTCDVFVDRNQVMYVTDTNAGLYIMEMSN
jgi:hypothetical protein